MGRWGERRRRTAWEGDPGRAADGLPFGAVWVRLPRFIGDGVMIHQALEPLRAAGIPLVAWGPPPLVELFRGSEAFAGVHADGEERGAWTLGRLLRAAGARAVVNLPRSTRASLSAWLARVPLRVGWRGGAGVLFSNVSRAFPADGHQLDNYRMLLEAGFPGLPEAAPRPFRPRPEALAQGDAALRELGLLDPRRPFVVLALGALACNKRLGTVVWTGLIRRLRERSIPHLLLGGPGDDVVQAAEILAALPGVPDLAGKVPLSVTAAIIGRAAALVGNDSATSHLAAACGTPAVVVFGPTRPATTAPRGPKVRVVVKEGLDCLGCRLFGCPVEGHPCMEAIDPGRLMAELDPLLDA
jgi:heptosyltransferase-2